MLAGENTLVRAGIRSLLEKVPDVETVGEADGVDLLDLVARRSPDVLLLDLAMSGFKRLATVTEVAERFPTVRVVVLSEHASAEYVLEALRAGAAGYLLKKSSTKELELAMRAAARGETFLSREIPSTVLEVCRERAQDRKSPLGQLTARQREILRLIAESKNTKEIADRLQVSAKTVEFHRKRLMDRLSIHDVPGLVRYAMRIGLISLESSGGG